jgi:twitching motility protein PilT
MLRAPMPILDSYIKTLLDHAGADAIGLASGHPVTLVIGAERKAVGPVVEMGRLEEIVRDAFSAEERATFVSTGRTERTQSVSTSSASAKVRITARSAHGGMQVMVTLVGKPTPSGPLSLEGAPVVPPSASPGASTAGPHPIDALFRELVKKGGSDLYVCTGKKAMIRKDGDLVAIGQTVLTEDEVRKLVLSIANGDQRSQFEKTNDVDFAYELSGVARFRANLFRDRNGVGGIFRQIPVEVISSEKLGLSQAVLDLCMLNKGLVLVTGPTGSGKSTTLAAMIDYINRHRSCHIITIEDPIEFVHPDKRCVINQREVGSHTEGFRRALRAALREDPDIVLVGEMRDLETVAIAIETAETGHLVFGTLHTNTAASTVDRIIDQFPPEQQQQIRTMLGEALKGVISQTLCKKKGGGRIAALEILLVPPAVSNLIREAKTHQLPSVMQTGKQSGMVTLNDALFELVERGLVAADEAVLKAVDKSDLKQRLGRAGIAVAG